MTKSINERLAEETQDIDLCRLRDHVNSLVKASRAKMSEMYSKWDTYNDTYEGLRYPDEDDYESRNMQEPEKMIVPMSYAQVQTFVAFCFLLFTQNRRLFELEPTGVEDHQLREDCEMILDRDLRLNKYHTVLYQMLLDVARFGVCICRHSWVTRQQLVEITPPPLEQTIDGILVTQTQMPSKVPVTKYEGNELHVISPYNFFPDRRFPLSEWHKGSYVADETEWHINELKKQEAAGIMFGIEHVEPMKPDGLEARGMTRLEAFTASVGRSSSNKDDHVVVLTTAQVEVKPKDYKLGSEDMPVKYLVVIANDQRIVRCEPLGYLHDDWTYDVGLFSPDARQVLTQSLSNVIEALQSVVSYLINTRLMSIKKGLENNVVVDPAAIDMSTLQSRSPYILMKKSAPKLGVDRFLRQLQYQDHTANHMNDASQIMSIMQMVTGVNENAMGQYNGGRRSATEARAVQSGAASRLRVVATLLWQSCFAPMGAKLLSNLRQGLSQEMFVKALGNSPEVAARYPLFRPSDPTELVGNTDFFVFDSTLQSEKGFIAQSLQELFTAMISSPEVSMMMQIDPSKILKEILLLRGINNIERFNYDQQPQPVGIPQQGGLPTNAPGAPGVPIVPGLQAQVPPGV